MPNLEERISTAKSYLNTELVNIKNGNNANFDRQEIAYHLDTIFEVERTGVRHLDVLQEVKINRVLTTVEEVMGVPSEN